MATAADTQQQRYVHVREMRGDGFVEFDFSINDPELYVELILPETAFWEFCSSNRVHFLSDNQAEVIDQDREQWREASAPQLQQ
ncbi:phenol hydroxylase [Pseudomaricurvus alkylphenolicus]|jgi:phenol hydroxylase P0 protein|uniref:phenol hydroxylase subunit n=1 Tax=Pseudomaricurvus alkylphenolicus TaxID=1306991 RepID=UPI0014218028|nr:phenol hydroxylase subunit [Pseudomaricurvus alkylphenolicus]NIB42228.1 phenol hydroxylase [Pseudomaricurvus alkylphenolicus]